jgi:hypothetical protein
VVNQAATTFRTGRPPLRCGEPQRSAGIGARASVRAALLLSLGAIVGCHRPDLTNGWSESAETGPAGDASGVALIDQYSTATGASVLLARNHLNRDGLFANTGISKASLATMQRDNTFAGTVNGSVFASPLYVENGPQGHGAFFVATATNYVYALDEGTGTPLPGWPIQAGQPASLAASLAPGCLSVSPLGIVGTPAIDLATRLIVFDAVTGDSSGNILAHTIQGWSIDDPASGPVWTVNVSAKWPAFQPQRQLQRSAVIIVNGVAYLAFGSFNDCDPYNGWVIGVPLAHPDAPQAFMTPVIGAGIWGPGGPASDGTSVFAVTGNRRVDFDLDAGPSWAGSSAVFRFGPALTFSGQSADYYVPPNWDDLDRNDEDLGASGPLVVDAPALTPSALLVAIGKDGIARLLDRNNLGGLDGGVVASKELVQGIPGIEGQILNVAASATVSGATYIVVKGWFDATAADCPLPPDGSLYDLIAIKLDPTAQNNMATAWCVSSGGMGSPSITLSDDANDAIVWTEGAEGDNLLHAWDLVTGTALYSSGTQTLGPVRHFATPIAVNGRVLVAGEGMLYAFTTVSNTK